eukprot:1015608-Amorphochlora_amoeboformis.AAC.1
MAEVACVHDDIFPPRIVKCCLVLQFSDSMVMQLIQPNFFRNVRSVSTKHSDPRYFCQGPGFSQLIPFPLSVTTMLSHFSVRRISIFEAFAW